MPRSRLLFETFSAYVVPERVLPFFFPPSIFRFIFKGGMNRVTGSPCGTDMWDGLWLRFLGCGIESVERMEEIFFFFEILSFDRSFKSL